MGCRASSRRPLSESPGGHRRLEGQQLSNQLSPARNVYLLKSEGFEPARGSWGHVSEPIMSIDRDWLVSLQRLGGVPIKSLERDVDRHGDMSSLELVLR